MPANSQIPLLQLCKDASGDDSRAAFTWWSWPSKPSLLLIQTSKPFFQTNQISTFGFIQGRADQFHDKTWFFVFFGRLTFHQCFRQSDSNECCQKLVKIIGWVPHQTLKQWPPRKGGFDCCFQSSNDIFKGLEAVVLQLKKQ